MTDTETNSTLPLEGLRVLELGNIVAAPYASLILADLGADVVKIERPGVGDVMRNSEESGDAIFLTLNRNKRSVTLDLKSKAGRQAYLDLANDADVVIENLGPGVVDRLGIDYETLSEGNPGLVYCSIKGFLDGPYGDRAGIDMVGEAMSGLMSMTGRPGDRPCRVGTSMADMGAAMFGLMGILTALWRRAITGSGRKVTGSLFESASHWMSYWSTYAQLTGSDHPSLGSSHPTFSLYDVFETEIDDEWLFVGVATPRQFPAFCRAVGMEELLVDERFDTQAKRIENKELLRESVAAELAEREREELLDSLLDEEVPAAPVNHPSDLVDDPHLQETGLLTDFSGEYDGEERDLTGLLAPIVGDDFRPQGGGDPPKLGEHSRDVLSEAGYTDDRIDAMFDADVSGQE